MRNIVLFILFFIVLIPSSICARYVVMFSNNYPPYNFINEEGTLVGFNVDILNAIESLYDDEIQIKEGEWHDINYALENGEAQAIAGIHYPGSPDNRYIYTRSALNTSHCFLYNGDRYKNFSLEQFRSFKEPLVALWKNDVLIRYVHSINPTVKFLFVDNYEQLIQSLDREDVTCIFSQKVASKYQAERLGKSYIQSLNHLILERNMGFKVAKDTPELAELLNNGLEVILANGDYQRIYDKWITKYSKNDKHWRNYLKYVWSIAFVTLILFLLLLVVNRILKYRVQSRTKDLQEQLKLNSIMMKELEEQRTKAVESDKMKSVFLANMSHEIRTPMNGILGFTELLRSLDSSPEEQKHFINIIEQSGNRMLETINNLIDVSKLEAGIESAHYTEVNIKDVLSKLHEFFHQETTVKGIDLFLLEKGSNTSDGFFTDEYKLNSILTNLMKNSIKFTSEGSVSVKYSISNDDAKFWVIDTGVGIVQNKLASIFDQFVQVDISHSRGYEGSGLGLSITKAYAELLGGEISVQSEPQKGTTFYVRIPNHKFSD